MEKDTMQMDIKRIAAKKTINVSQLTYAEKADELIKKELAHEIAEYILNNFNELPIAYKKERDVVSGTATYTLMLNLAK